MKLRAKIKAKYLDDILSGKKVVEYRQFESMVLTDETGRTSEFKILHMGVLSKTNEDVIRKEYSDIPWSPTLWIWGIHLGDEIEVKP